MLGGSLPKEPLPPGGWGSPLLAGCPPGTSRPQTGAVHPREGVFFSSYRCVFTYKDIESKKREKIHHPNRKARAPRQISSKIDFKTKKSCQRLEGTFYNERTAISKGGTMINMYGPNNRALKSIEQNLTE